MKFWISASVVALSAVVSAQRANPLLTPSTLPFQAPVFDRITDADFQPALEEGMRQQLQEIESIAKEDPFCKLGLADFRVIEFRVSQRADDLETRISKE